MLGLGWLGTSVLLDGGLLMCWMGQQPRLQPCSVRGEDEGTIIPGDEAKSGMTSGAHCALPGRGFFSFIFLRDQTGDKMRQDGPSWVGKILSGLHLARCWAKRTTTTKKEKEEGEKKGDDEVDDGSTFPLFWGGVKWKRVSFLVP